MQIYVALVSLQHTLTRNALALTDVPGFVCDHGFSGFEVLDRRLSAASAADLDATRRACEAASCAVVVDAGCDLTPVGREARRSETARLKNTIDMAARLHSGTVRITLGGQALSVQKLFWRSQARRAGRSGPQQGALQGLLASAHTRRWGYLVRAWTSNYLRRDPGKQQRAAELLREVLPCAAERGISLAIENHWGISSRPQWILEVIDAVGSPHLGTCPDFGNFPTRVDRYTGLALLAPAALHVQAKCWRFDANGDETTIDYGRCLDILRRTGYAGAIAVEYEGGGDEEAACARARKLLLRHG